MESTGFVNYGYEWWHYSYGDRYWACARLEPALYGPL
jgi:D-alanyl-D-alanine dipeptidase